MIADNIKLAVFDVDGTLLDKRCHLSDEVVGTLRWLKSRGIELALATGRSLQRVLEYTDRIDNGMKLILVNGAWVHDLAAGEDMLALNLHRKTARRAIELLRKWGYEIIVQKGIPESHIFYYDTFDENNVERVGRIRRNFDRCIRVADLLNVVEDNPAEITILDTTDRILRCRERLSESLQDCRLIYSTSPFTPGYSWLEILHYDVNKGTALEFIAGHMGLSSENIMAVGDNYNDIEMIKWAGVGVAVGHAEPELKKFADIILPDGDAGLLEIKRLLTNKR